MKKVLLLAVGILFSFSACGEKEEDLGDSYIFGQDNQYYFEGNAKSLAESEENYYLFGEDYLFAKNKETGETTILCDKPDCRHDYETDMTRRGDCNAYYGNGSQVYYYNGKLYVITTGVDIEDNYSAYSAIYETDLTGSTRKEILKPKGDMLAAMVHRGYIYLSFSDFLEDPEVYEKNEEKREDSSYRVERYRIDKPSKKPEVIFEKTGEYGQINELKAYGNKIYLGGAAADDGIDIIYDIQTKKAEEFSGKTTGDVTFFRGNILYHEVSEEEGKTRLSDLEGNVIDTLQVPDSIVRFSNDDLIVNDNQFEVLLASGEPEERAIQIYDENGSFIKEVKLGNRGTPSIGMNEDYFFYLKESEEQSGEEIWAIDLSRLDEENLAGEPFFAYLNPTGLSGSVTEY